MFAYRGLEPRGTLRSQDSHTPSETQIGEMRGSSRRAFCRKTQGAAGAPAIPSRATGCAKRRAIQAPVMISKIAPTCVTIGEEAMVRTNSTSSAMIVQRGSARERQRPVPVAIAPSAATSMQTRKYAMIRPLNDPPASATIAALTSLCPA